MMDGNGRSCIMFGVWRFQYWASPGTAADGPLASAKTTKCILIRTHKAGMHSSYNTK